MKKQIKKLTLNKKTIANLSVSEMNKQIGGQNASAHCGTGICTENWCTLTCYNSFCGGHGHTCNKPCGY